MHGFHDGPDRVSAASEPPASYDLGAHHALGVTLRRVAASLAHQEPSAHVTPFVLADVLDGEAESPEVELFLHAVADYVRALRAGGSSPEQAVIAVKRHLQIALGAGADPRRVNAWLAHAVTWGIEAYYRDD